MVEFAEEYSYPAVTGGDVCSNARAAAPATPLPVMTSAPPELIGRLSALYRIADLSVREPQVEATIRRIYEGQLLRHSGEAECEGQARLAIRQATVAESGHRGLTVDTAVSGIRRGSTWQCSDLTIRAGAQEDRPAWAQPASRSAA